MTRKITDTKTFQVQVIEHGFAQILNVIIPTSVEKDQPFTIQYDVKNTATTADELWGQIYQDDVVISGTEWSEIIQPSETVTKAYNHPGLTASATIKIEAGHE